ncbi:TIGR03936 family radical SAM-associated protein [Schnuerera sp. xch1]|uniref:TIGR03936 family radical SAM-associated protein n=1 Tax=Schnuerera sp. xch1 TaxID=2874283 RepID=UPI001CC0538E|nr:TIGR03936 family radical SAM-associated protein [Schnuerera sp. xch1]MBZ2175351.1 TIGR03936 family radical SAM-associated protein [Schnuerera sp. xch1]
MNLRVKFTKENYLKYISHLDLMRLFKRAFRRGQMPIKYSQGFNAQPKLSIANPLALGIESIEEYMDIDLNKKIPEEEFIKIMNKELPEDIRILDVKYLDNKKSISSQIRWGYYQIKVRIGKIKDVKLLESLIKEWLDKDQIIIKKIKRKRKKIIEKDKDIKHLIGNVTISSEEKVKLSDSEYLVTINCLLRAGDNGNLKPTDFLEGMDKYIDVDIDMDSADIKRLNMFSEEKGEIKKPM